MTGLCQRPILPNRTRSVVPGAYWTVTGRCLHRVWPCDHRVRSSREKRISPFLTVRSDLVSFSFVSIHRRSYPSRLRHNLAEHRLLDRSPRPHLSTAPAPSHATAAVSCLRARKLAARTTAARPCLLPARRRSCLSAEAAPRATMPEPPPRARVRCPSASVAEPP
jgi:hypothetical protein